MRYKFQIYFVIFLVLSIYLITYYSSILKPNEQKTVVIKDNNNYLFEYYAKLINNSLLLKNDEENNNDEINYPNLLKCNTFYENNKPAEIWMSADEKLHALRIVRGVILYYPSDKTDWFEQEFKWLYRSWVEMQKYEPQLWRTDLIVFTNTEKLGKSNQFFMDLDCLKTNIRKSKEDKPMCTIIDYVAIKDRDIKKTLNKNYETVEEIYNDLYKKINVFDEKSKGLEKFYEKLKELNDYNYIDSILMGFEGYSYFKNNFDFLLRSDMDVFLTPLFGKWLPINCNDFIVGGGGYSHDFNMKRLRRIALNLKLKFGNIRNLGSTWYSTPEQFRLVSYLTLVSMVFISSEEFSETERKGKVGTILWPEWHYGVLLLYGQNLAMNHLIASKKINVTKLETLIDFPSANEESVFKKVHIHVFHGENLFSKFMFRDGKYDNYNRTNIDLTKIKYYTLNIALESKLLAAKHQNILLKEVIKKKE